jgi:hypothetical protein
MTTENIIGEEDHLSLAIQELEPLALPKTYAAAILAALREKQDIRQRVAQGLFEEANLEFLRGLNFIERERVPIGVDMVTLHAYLPDAHYDRKPPFMFPQGW